MKNKVIIFLMVVGLVTLSKVTMAANKPVKPGSNNAPQSVNANDCFKANARTELNANNVRTLVWNDGTMWWDHVGTARYEVPKNLDNNAVKKNSMFAGGIWIGGQERTTGVEYVMAMTYAQGGEAMYFPGPIDSIQVNTTRARCNAWDQIWTIDKNVIQKFAIDYAAGNIRSKSDVPDQILYWPGYKNVYLSGRVGNPMTLADVSFHTARFVDKDNDGIYNPVNGDYPQLPGDKGTKVSDIASGADQCLFFVNNDASNLKRIDNNTTVPTIGMEVHTEAFSYATADPRNDMTFYRNKLINKGNVSLNNCYFAQYCDPDLGYAADDYVGCDVGRGLGICYNGDDFDETLLGYGENPPSIGVDFFIGPVADPSDGVNNDKDDTLDEPGEKIILSNFMTYNNSGSPVNSDPQSVRDFYNFLQSKWRATQGADRDIAYDLGNGTNLVGTSSRLLNGQLIRPAKFMYPDTSDQRVCWGQGFSKYKISFSGEPRPNPCDSINGRFRLPAWTEDNAIYENTPTVGNPPGDRRFLSSAGPFTLEPGAVNQLTIGIVWARASSGGRKGSFGKLLVNDDIAQKLFDNDFVGINGPNEPKVEIAEFDKQLILTLTSDTVLGVSTENYTVTDGSLNPSLGSTQYKFQGYMVYQLADATVSTTDLDNPDKARLVAQSDVRDDIGTVTNSTYDPELGIRTTKVMVRGANAGLKRVINITNDVFNSNTGLINFKPYYFRVIAYAYNGNTSNQGLRYLISTPRRDPSTNKNITILSAIPHKVEAEKGGTIINSRFNLGKSITRLTGIGNGGNVLDSLPTSQYAGIKDTLSVPRNLKYGGNTSPIAIKVFNPKKVRGGSFKIEISSRIRMRKTGSYLPAVGDIIVSKLDLTTPSSTDSVVSKALVQAAGRARVNRVIPTGNIDEYDLDISMFNDDEGGRFTKVVESFVKAGSQFSDYSFTSAMFAKEGDATATAQASEYYSADYWKMTELSTGSIIYSTYFISQAQEQLLSNYGISVIVSDAVNPGELYEIHPGAGLQSGTVVYANVSQTWLNESLSTSRPNANGIIETNLWTVAPVTPPLTNSQDYTNWANVDKQGRYLSVLGNSWAPYQACTTTVSGGPKSVVADVSLDGTGRVLANLRRLKNVDIIMTNDTSKWSRVVVLQLATQKVGSGITSLDITAFKSTKPSLNKFGTPSGEVSAYGNNVQSSGVSWFPGYAIDLDRGVRLNLMFSEDRDYTDPDITKVVDSTTVFGDDLKYQFSKIDFRYLKNQSYVPTKHYIYVTDFAYDGARSLEKSFDSIRVNSMASSLRGVNYSKIMNGVMWVGNLAVAIGEKALATEATVKLRVDRKFESYPRRGGDTLTNPVYQFDSDGLETVTQNEGAAKSALDLIRVVPNPYYAYSPYESDKVDNRVIITNLPSKCKVSIYTLSGSLVRQFNIDRSGITSQNEATFQDWDLKNANGLPIASGFYLIHIDAGNIGERTVKFFGVMRPLDLSGLSQN